MMRRYEFLQLNLEERMPAWKVAQLAGVHENTIYHWKAALKCGGIEALQNQSRAPKTHPNAYSDDVKALIRTIRGDGFAHERRPKKVRVAPSVFMGLVR